MEKQFGIYSVDTKAFYTPKERKLNSDKFKIKKQLNIMENWAIYNHYMPNKVEYIEYKCNFYKLEYLKKLKNKTPNEEIEINKLKKLFKPIKYKRKNNKDTYKTAQELKLENDISEVKFNKTNKEIIKEQLKDNSKHILLKTKLKQINLDMSALMVKANVRVLNPASLNVYSEITLFENSLSRTMGIKSDEVVADFIVVRAYHYEVLKQLIENGFEYADKDGVIHEYITFTASAGQIRTKKVIFMKKEQWMMHEKSVMCGLTIADINNSREKGCNINKFLAYLALCNSATDEIEDFDIDRSVVIDDFESIVRGVVDSIDNKTFKVTRKEMDIPIPHSDGCGWTSPDIADKNYMIRLPWVKGLQTPVDFIRFCDEFRNGNYKIIDIYGKEWDLKEDNIKYVFSRSQFKMYKYYESWDDYKTKFKENNCKANMCNLEPNTKQFRKASFNYQMWQTLTDITDEEIRVFTDPVDDFITKGYSNRDTMLKLLKADKDNLKKTNLQKCIEIYPELIRDYHVKEELASMLNARKKDAKFGKFKINGTYTFLIPDVFAWMENVFLGHKTPIGLLKNGEVSCKLYNSCKELLVNRSPHLYREHGVRANSCDDNTKKWFLTNGVYTSSHDLISKILQFDNDGDKGLVISDPTLIEIARRNMKGIVPLYYEMGKASAKIINNKNIYESLTRAFSFNNIGKYSNKLSVMWNLKNPNLETIAQITALNNFTIDAAKTLLVPEVPRDIEQSMKESNGKLPYFFQFAKDKDSSDVALINNSTVNRICRNIENIKQGTYDFSSIGKFNKNYLMCNKDIEINNDIINTYKKLESEKNTYMINAKNLDVKKEDVIDRVYKNIKKEFSNECASKGYGLVEGIDMVILYIYTTNKNSKKGLLFDLFGDIIYENLLSNIKKPLGEGFIMCECCGDRARNKNGKTLYCKKCAKIIKNDNDRERIKKIRENM